MDTLWSDLARYAALAGAGLFSGASLYVNLVEHPARLSCGVATAMRLFPPSYRRAARMQAFLALLSGVGGLAAGLSGGGVYWSIGGVFMLAIIALTLIVIMPVNRRLLAPTPPAQAGALLRLWGRLHAVRSLLALAAFVLFLAAWPSR